jgi:hypothetical protein
VLAKAIGACQPQLALLLPGSAPEPLNHARAPRPEPQPRCAPPR